MKKLTSLFIIVVGFCSAYSQDVRKDSLNAQDTIIQLKGKIGKLEKEIAGLNEQIRKLDKKNIKKLEEDLQKNKESIEKLNATIAEKNALIADERSEAKKNEQKKLEEGKHFVYDKIAQEYLEKPIDNLVSHSTGESVGRDMQLIGGNEEARKKMQQLQVYFAARQMLGKRFDEQDVKNMQEQLKTITQSELAKNLNSKLDDYKLYNDGLKAAVDKIIKLDSQFTGNTESTKKSKQLDILAVLSRYCFDYPGLVDYPYLTGVVLDIMMLKQKDPNADIKDIQSKL